MMQSERIFFSRFETAMYPVVYARVAKAKNNKISFYIKIYVLEMEMIHSLIFINRNSS